MKKNFSKFNLFFAGRISIAAILLTVVFAASAFFAARDFIKIAASGLATNARLVKAAGSPTVYFISPQGYRLPIPSAKVFFSYGYVWDSVETVPPQEMDYYKDARFIRQQNRSAIYFLDSGVKKLLSAAAAKSLNVGTEEIINVSAAHFASIKTGGSLSLADAEKINIQSNSKAAVLAEEDAACVPSGEAGGKDGCVIYQAMQNNDESLCEQIADQSWKGRCYSGFIVQGSDTWQSCYKLTDVSAVDSCLSFAAAAAKNKTLCQNLSNSSGVKICGGNVGVVNKDPSGCADLKSAGQTDDADACYFSYALYNKDISACGKISTASKFSSNCAKLAASQSSAIQPVSQEQEVKNGLARLTNKLLAIETAKAQLDIITTPVGGKFLPGVLDIYTPSYICGLTVSVVGPNPGTFSFYPVYIYDYFLEAPVHAGTNTLGLASITPPCFNLYFLGSSLVP